MSLDLIVRWLFIDLIFSGRVFQIVGPEMDMARSPVFVRHRGMSNRLLPLVLMFVQLRRRTKSRLLGCAGLCNALCINNAVLSLIIFFTLNHPSFLYSGVTRSRFLWRPSEATLAAKFIHFRTFCIEVFEHFPHIRVQLCTCERTREWISSLRDSVSKRCFLLLMYNSVPFIFDLIVSAWWSKVRCLSIQTPRLFTLSATCIVLPSNLIENVSGIVLVLPVDPITIAWVLLAFTLRPLALYQCCNVWRSVSTIVRILSMEFGGPVYSS